MASGVKPIDLGVDIGTVFLGKYRVESILGQGGMGVVAECTHLALGERVAIKMLRKDVLLDPEAVERFQREAQAAAKLKSEYVARVSDVGVFEGNVPYMVMEFLEGHDLGQLLEQRGVLPVAWACELIMQTCEALAEAHSLGIVHRDVKPTNLFVTWRPDGSALVKVLDFGISKSPMGTDMQLTQTQSLLGTPAYMSPEQMRSARLVDWRSDIWSLGSVLYELIEGRRPFEADSFSEMCVKVAVDSPAPMVNAPPELQRVILRCLQKSPEQRYATMAELGADLIPSVQDQHQATRLVERMSRMLRRSSHSWDGDSSIRTPTPNPDALNAWRAKSEPMAVPLGMDRREPSVPVAAAPSTLMEQQQPKRRGLAIVVGVGLLFGAAVAAVVVVGGSKNQDPKDKKVEPAPATAVAPTPPPKLETPAPTPKVETAAIAAPPPPTPPAPVVVEKKPPVVVTSTTQKKPPVVKKPPVAIKKEDPPVAEVKEATVKPPVAQPPPKENCDPFSSMHGCNK